VVDNTRNHTVRGNQWKEYFEVGAYIKLPKEE
jgi:hypothetical protein